MSSSLAVKLLAHAADFVGANFSTSTKLHFALFIGRIIDWFRSASFSDHLRKWSGFDKVAILCCFTFILCLVQTPRLVRVQKCFHSASRAWRPLKVTWARTPEHRRHKSSGVAPTVVSVAIMKKTERVTHFMSNRISSAQTGILSDFLIGWSTHKSRFSETLVKQFWPKVNFFENRLIWKQTKDCLGFQFLETWISV